VLWAATSTTTTSSTIAVGNRSVQLPIQGHTGAGHSSDDVAHRPGSVPVLTPAGSGISPDDLPG
jgi:hypothetical protein